VDKFTGLYTAGSTSLNARQRRNHDDWSKAILALESGLPLSWVRPDKWDDEHRPKFHSVSLISNPLQHQVCYSATISCGNIGKSMVDNRDIVKGLEKESGCSIVICKDSYFSQDPEKLDFVAAFQKFRIQWAPWKSSGWVVICCLSENKLWI